MKREQIIDDAVRRVLFRYAVKGRESYRSIVGHCARLIRFGRFPLAPDAVAAVRAEFEAISAG